MLTGTESHKFRTEAVFFYALVAISIVPIWTVSYFPSQDGPNHLWILYLLDQYLRSGPGAFGEWFELNRNVEPNLGFYVIALPLSLVVGIQAAEKLFLSLFVAILCIGARYAVRSINANAIFVSYLILPVAFSLYVHMGFYNYLVGIALFMPALMLCIRQYHSAVPGRYWKIGTIGFAILLAHLLAFITLVMALAAYVTTDVVRSGIKEKDFWHATRRLFKEGGYIALVLLPSFLLIASFILRHGTSENPNYGRRYLVDHLLQLHMLVSFDTLELLTVSIPVVVLLAGLACYAIYVAVSKEQPNLTWLPLLVACLFMLVVYFTVPISTRDVPVGPRLVPFILLTGILWLAAGQWINKWALAVPVACAVLVITQTVLRVGLYAQADNEIKEYLSVTEAIQPGSTFLPVLLEELDVPAILGLARFRARPFSHVGGYIAIDRDAIYLGSLMAPSKFPYFPVVHQRDADPYSLLGSDIKFPRPAMDFEAYEHARAQPVDYLIVIGADWEGWKNAGEEQARSYGFMKANYNRLAVSSTGRYSLYQSNHLARDNQD